MRLSVATSVLVNYSIQDAIVRVTEAGYDGIDIWAGRPHIYRRDYERAELEGLRRLLQHSGLTSVSLMPAFYRYPYSLCNPREAVRQDTLEYMRQCADNAAALGARILLIVPTRRLFGQSLDDARLRLTESIDAVCRYAKQYDLLLGIEPANRSVTDLVTTSSDALAIIDALGYENLGVVLDSGHLNLTGESPVEAIRSLGPRLFQFHLSDNDGQRQQNLVPGEGTFDFAGLVRVLRQAGYCGFLTTELAWDYSLNPEPAIQMAAARIRRLLEEG